MTPILSQVNTLRWLHVFRTPLLHYSKYGKVWRKKRKREVRREKDEYLRGNGGTEVSKKKKRKRRKVTKRGVQKKEGKRRLKEGGKRERKSIIHKCGSSERSNVCQEKLWLDLGEITDARSDICKG